MEFNNGGVAGRQRLLGVFEPKGGVMQLLRAVMAWVVVGSALTLAACGGGGGGGSSTPAPSGDTVSPVVSMGAVANGATVTSSTPVTGNITVSVSASDDVGVTKVELYLDNVKLSEATSAPYNFSVNTAPLAKGDHSLIAKAYDAAGKVGLSSISFKVPIWISMGINITGSTAVGTVALHGLTIGLGAFGVDLHVDGLPNGVVIDSVTGTGSATQASTPTPDPNAGLIILVGTNPLDSESGLNIHFSGVPLNAVASDFRISLLNVWGAGVPIPIN
jgi:hypothetical protein